MAKLKLVNGRTTDEWAEHIQSQWRDGVKGIMDVGLSLCNAREELDAVDFKLVWERLRFSKGTVSKLITVGTDPKLMEVSPAKLPAHWDILYGLSRLTDEEFQRGLDTGVIHAGMARRDIAILKPPKNKPPRKTRIDISDQMMSCVADVRNAVLRTLEDRPFAEWPALIQELSAELTDIGSKLPEYEAELRQQGKQE